SNWYLKLVLRLWLVKGAEARAKARSVSGKAKRNTKCSRSGSVPSRASPRVRIRTPERRQFQRSLPRGVALLRREPSPPLPNPLRRNCTEHRVNLRRAPSRLRVDDSVSAFHEHRVFYVRCVLPVHSAPNDSLRESSVPHDVHTHTPKPPTQPLRPVRSHRRER